MRGHKFGLGAGPEVRWKDRKPEIKVEKRRKVKRKPERPKPMEKSPTHCTNVMCEHPGVKLVVPGRAFCLECATKLDQRAQELREREKARTVVTGSTDRGGTATSATSASNSPPPESRSDSP